MTVWLTRELLLAVHDEQIAEHGGASGIRDIGLQESALAWPINHAGYGAPDPPTLGALYALAIARNHPFIDGNKRTAFVALETFLVRNGFLLTAGDAEATVMMLDMAAGRVSDAVFVEWVRTAAQAL
ncbi:type II toxin-antitoxin system death-on-curing family toxin [Humitalea sp. 24SJ18S-53]|uniref:type II toxin-antitoxin system death-on-curing family toxin n=1 Tax=Humitalea sp. 24SJ18S-53 TaxID=3422307 RepID=UPI003D67564A